MSCYKAQIGRSTRGFEAHVNGKIWDLLIYLMPGLLTRNRMHFSQRGKRPLAQELVGLTDRTLK